MASEISVLQLAKDVLTETLHGPVPMRTVARLAEGVIAAEARLAAVREGRLMAAENQYVCEHCDKPATCFGAYEGHASGFACDDCCGHGCEDGECIPVVTAADLDAKDPTDAK